MLRERGETNQKKCITDVLSVVRGRGVIPYAEKGNIGNKKSDDIARYKVVRPGDIVLNSMNVIIGSVGMSRYTGCLSPVYYVLTPRTGEDDVRYLNAYFQTKPFQRSLVRIGNGILAHRMRIPMSLLRREPFPRPPLVEQTAIVRFLDHAEQHFGPYVRVKRKFIALLREQKQAVVNRAVTLGVDPNVQVSSSGIEWLGDIPQHWTVRRLRYLLRERLKYGANEAAESTNPNWPRYLRITDFRSDGSLRSDTFRSLPPDVAAGYLVEPGDLLFARSGATVGKVFLVKEETGLASFAGYLIRARPDTSIMLPMFLFEFTQSSAFDRWKDATFSIATIQNIGADKYADLIVPLPPLDEQARIIRQVGEAGAKLDRSISAANHEIELVQEFRERLIVDVVTGKLDVREAAKTLAEGPAPIDEDYGALLEDEDSSDDPGQLEDDESAA